MYHQGENDPALTLKISPKEDKAHTEHQTLDHMKRPNIRNSNSIDMASSDGSEPGLGPGLPFFGGLGLDILRRPRLDPGMGSTF